MIKRRNLPDGFLSWLHVLMLMDDTVIFASSREQLTRKLEILGEYCAEFGMQVNEAKTEFMVINGTPRDRENIVLSELTVKHCTSYVYLGVIVTENGSSTASLKAHVAEKKKHLNRLNIFLSRNHDAPFFVKRKVFDAAFSSAILYGCESWIDVSLAPVEGMYMTAVRRLLDVRSSTPKLTCLVEAGLPSLQALIKQKQSKFLRKMFVDRDGMLDDPLMFTLAFMKENCETTFQHIQDVMQRDDYIIADRNELCRQLRETPPDKTKLRLYSRFNPDLTVHPLYKVTDSKSCVEDNLRVTFTRIRLCSHSLRSETGRWYRVPADQRLCPHCHNQSIQNEEHLLQCPATLRIRSAYGVETDIHSLLKEPSKSDLICMKKCLKLLESINEPILND